MLQNYLLSFWKFGIFLLLNNSHFKYQRVPEIMTKPTDATGLGYFKVYTIQ